MFVHFSVDEQYRNEWFFQVYWLVANCCLVGLIEAIGLNLEPCLLSDQMGPLSYHIILAGPGQLGKVMGEIRRAMSVTIVRANALCLMERLCQLGPGARAAAQRRQAALHLEERRRQERQAFDLAWQARRSSRVGRAFIE